MAINIYYKIFFHTSSGSVCVNHDDGYGHWYELASKSAIPTNVSQLNNNRHFVNGIWIGEDFYEPQDDPVSPQEDAISVFLPEYPSVEESNTNGNIIIDGTETNVYTHPGSGTNPHGTTASDVGLGNVGNFKAVSTVANQGLSDTEKANARNNIGAGTSSFSGSYADLQDKPSINDVELNGNKTASELGLQAELDGAQTATGNPITVTDAEPMNAESVKVELEPKQDLHGYDAPWVGGSGKNLLPMMLADIKSANTSGTWSGNSYTFRGVTFSLKSDDGVSVTSISTSGISSGDIYFKCGAMPLSNNTNYILSGCAASGNANTYSLYLYCDESETLLARDIDESGIPFTAVSTFSSIVNLMIKTNINMDSKVFYPMIRLATESDSTFAPYSNICPITGYSEVNIERVGKNWCPYDKITTNASGYFTLASGSYTFSFKCLGTPKYSTSKIILRDANNNDLVFVPYTGTPVGGYLSGTFTISESTSCQILNENVNVDSSGYAIDNIQIESGNERTTYEPYQGSTATISLGGTKYGGTLDVTSGVLTVDKKYYTIDSLTQSTSTTFYSTITVGEIKENTPIICDRIETANIVGNVGIRSNQYGATTITTSEQYESASDYMTQLGGELNIVCELATPLTIQLTPTQIQMLENTNNISTDGTNIQLKYQPNNVIGECKAYTDEQIEKHNPLNYSTDEKAVGTWIDGKTIYQKTIDLGSAMLVTSETSIKQYLGDLYDEIESFIMAFATSSVNKSCHPVYLQKVNNDAQLWLTVNADSASVEYLTIQYTKI